MIATVPSAHAPCDISSDIAADWLSTPVALSQHCTRVLPGLVVIRSELTGRYFAAFPRGGEVYATGSLGKAPLQNFVFNVTPAGSGVWASVQHVTTGLYLTMLSRNAPEGSWMLRLQPKGAPSPRNQRFCFEGKHLKSRETAGYVNVRNLVLLRGHGDPPGGNRLPATSAAPGTHVATYRVSDASLLAGARASAAPLTTCCGDLSALSGYAISRESMSTTTDFSASLKAVHEVTSAISLIEAMILHAPEAATAATAPSAASPELGTQHSRTVSLTRSPLRR